MSKNLALVLGGYVNGYSIIRELKDCNVSNVWLVDSSNSLASYSNKINGFTKIEDFQDRSHLRNVLYNLHDKYDYIVLFPTSEAHLKALFDIKDEIKSFCFLPFNNENLLKSLDKHYQYKYCEVIGIPYPKTIAINCLYDIESLNGLIFPLIIKPNNKNYLNINIFRSIYLENEEALTGVKDQIKGYLEIGIEFIVSEFIPGDDSNMYSYNCYRSKDGLIMNEWGGRKLSQYPNEFGVFSSASNEAPEIVKEQGRKLISEMDLEGIVEPEFKYDSRDDKYKLMEISLRSTMWHRVGNLSGVNLLFTQWMDATDQEVPKFNQDTNKILHLVYMKHEILNLIFRSNYFMRIKNNLFSTNKVYFSVFDTADPFPFLFDLKHAIKVFIVRCLKVLKIR